MFIDTPSPTPITFDHLYYNNIQFGSTNKEKLDIWIPMNVSEPTGLIVYWHGGGFVTGNHDSAHAAFDIDELIGHGIAVVSAEYDFVEVYHERFNGIMGSVESAFKAVQFMKFHSEFFNIDKTRILAHGGSAGAGLAAIVGYSSDQKDLGAANPMLHESTRVKAVLLENPQSTYNFSKWDSEIFNPFIPEYSGADEYNNVFASKIKIDRIFGTVSWAQHIAHPDVAKVDITALIAAGGGVDTHFTCANTLHTTMQDEWSITDIEHSPYHGINLKNHFDTYNVPYTAFINGLYNTPAGETKLEFKKRMLINNASYEPELQAVIDFALSQFIGIPDSATLAELDTLMISMKASGYWATRDVFYIFQYNDVNLAAFSKICWVRLQSLTTFGVLTYSINGWEAPGEGFNGGFSTGYNASMDTAPGGGPLNQTELDAEIEMFVYRETAHEKLAAMWGHFVSPATAGLNINDPEAGRLKYNENSAPNVPFDGTGLMSISRTSSSATRSRTPVIMTDHFNALSVEAAVGINEHLLIFKDADRGSDIIAGSFASGSSITDTQYTTFATALNTLFTSLGV